MFEEDTITTKEGKNLSIKELIKRMEDKEKGDEFNKVQKEELKEKRKCIGRRVMKKAITPEFDKKCSEVRYLTDKEILEEYIMGEEIMQGRSKAYRILNLLKEFHGRKVSTEVIATGIKDSNRHASSILSQLRASGIVVASSSLVKGKKLWALGNEFLDNNLDDMVKAKNDFIRKRRKLNRKAVVVENLAEEEVIEETAEVTIKFGDEETEKKEEVLGERLKELKIEEEKDLEFKELLEEQQNILKRIEQEKKEILSSNTLKVVVEGHIKILFGLVE